MDQNRIYFTIYEPFDFIYELSEIEKSKEVSLVREECLYENLVYDVYKVKNPFIYEDYLVDYMFLSKRYVDRDEIFNAHIGIWNHEYMKIDRIYIHAFIGKLH